MRAILVVAAVVAALVVCAVAQEEYKCTTPPEWYADFVEFNPTRETERFGRIYYDEANERIAFREDERSPNGSSRYTDIFLHKEKIGFRIDNTTGRPICRTFPLNEPFPKIGPYLDDSYRGEAYIGSAAQAKDGVRVVMYSGSNERGHFFGVWIPAGEDTCVPVSETFTRESATERSTSTMRYYNVRLGIFTPEVFDPPPTCIRPVPPPSNAL